MTSRDIHQDDCLAPGGLAAMAEGRLEGQELDRCVSHLARCPECYEVFASSVKDLADAGWLDPAAGDSGVQSEERPSGLAADRARSRGRRSTFEPAWAAWAAAAAVLLAVSAWFLREPVGPLLRQGEPPARTASRTTDSPSPSPAAGTPVLSSGSLPPDGWAALRLLHGPPARVAHAATLGLVRDARAEGLRAGIEEVHAVAFGNGAASPAAPGSPATSPESEEWRRVGRILEASRLALLRPAGPPAGFFDSEWVGRELRFASNRLGAAGLADAALPGDVLRDGSSRLDGQEAQRLVERIDALFGRLL